MQDEALNIVFLILLSQECHCKSERCHRLTQENEESPRKRTSDMLHRKTYIMRLIKVRPIVRARDRKEP